MTDDDLPFYQGVLDADEEFQDSDLGEMMLQGRVGFHTFYSNDEPLGGTDTAMHKTLDSMLEMMFLDTEHIEERHDELTPETVAEEFGRELDACVGLSFRDRLVAEFEDKLREQVAAEESEDGGSDD